jgi:hypothetical protein
VGLKIFLKLFGELIVNNANGEERNKTEGKKARPWRSSSMAEVTV